MLSATTLFPDFLISHMSLSIVLSIISFVVYRLASLSSYRMPLRADLVYDRFFIMYDISLISFMNSSCDKLFFIPFLVRLYYILRCFICKSFWQNRKLIGKISKNEKLFKQFLISFFFEFRKIRQFL